jgi:hypothetical protein
MCEQEETEIRISVPIVGRQWQVVVNDAAAQVRTAVDALPRRQSDNVIQLRLLSYHLSGREVSVGYGIQEMAKEAWEKQFNQMQHIRPAKSNPAVAKYPAVAGKPKDSGMYRPLTQRDVIASGDEQYDGIGKTWRPAEPDVVGRRKGDVFGWFVKMRRLK